MGVGGGNNQRGERPGLGDRKCVYVLEPARKAAALISHDGTSEAFLRKKNENY